TRLAAHQPPLRIARVVHDVVDDMAEQDRPFQAPILAAMALQDEGPLLRSDQQCCCWHRYFLPVLNGIRAGEKRKSVPHVQQDFTSGEKNPPDCIRISGGGSGLYAPALDDGLDV